MVQKKNLTLKDIAKELGVSTATVSLAINNSSLVAEKTRLLVLSKIKEVGYVYNRRAASLITGKSGMVGLAVHDFTNPYFTEVCASAEKTLAQEGRMSLLCNSHESLPLQERFINALIEHNSDGLLLCPVVGTEVEQLQPLLTRGLPTVLVTRDVDGANMDFVGNDERFSFHLATRHLINLGHKRIAFIGGALDAKAARDRRSGYVDALKLNGLPVDERLLFDCDNHSEAAEKILPEVLSIESPPTAIVGFSDLIALGVLSALIALGLEPGKDIAVVGCDNIAESSRHYSQLTTVNVQKSQIGQMAASFLFQRLQNPHMPPQRKIFESELIVRRSCGAYRVS
ncbi:LacI family DNA-binding transcriptional regulator [Marinomonas pollencensis]|uniref:LacI family transcriptional regulator n=1 Tax=Marinomonas pollencensis TaxID=491954 RepID=A0A3E0DA47_9GAMM|nr:LacI family DNA-binding transcriptional regulator [Marinomonas pollencensis]REG79556.1 LacI family transcriptional regulator [Marinomonas pollencensis]